MRPRRALSSGCRNTCTSAGRPANCVDWSVRRVMLQPGLLRRRMGTKLKLGRASWCASKPCAQGTRGVHQRPRVISALGRCNDGGSSSTLRSQLRTTALKQQGRPACQARSARHALPALRRAIAGAYRRCLSAERCRIQCTPAQRPRSARCSRTGTQQATARTAISAIMRGCAAHTITAQAQSASISGQGQRPQGHRAYEGCSTARQSASARRPGAPLCRGRPARKSRRR